MFGNVLNSYGKKELKSNWRNFVMSDSPLSKFKNKKKIYSVVNTDTMDKNGSHWIPIYIEDNTFYINDSFSNTPRLNTFYKNIKKNGMDYKLADYKDNHQNNNKLLKTACGQLSLAWLILVKNIGISNAMKL